jgi:large subunit ribosomal protein L22
MGKRKKIYSEKLKQERRKKAYAILRNYRMSPRKMRLVADMIRGMDVQQALDTLQYTKKAAAEPIRKLLLTALNDWEQKHEGERVEDADLYVKEIRVDGAGMLKRVHPRAQGRAFLIRRRFSHVTIVVDSKKSSE